MMYAPVHYQPQHPAVTRRIHNMAVASLACGAAALPFFWLGLITLGLVSVSCVLGLAAFRTASLNRIPVPGLATAGVITGAVALVAYVAFGLVTSGIGFVF